MRILERGDCLKIARLRSILQRCLALVEQRLLPGEITLPIGQFAVQRVHRGERLADPRLELRVLTLQRFDRGQGFAKGFDRRGCAQGGSDYRRAELGIPRKVEGVAD